jgi:putative SOS response-associated peptidase YedK
MCFFFKQSTDALTLENRFKAKFENPSRFSSSANYNGFLFPKTPVITNVERQKIQWYHWGLLPHWATDISFRKNTLNAKIETISSKPSFKNSIHNRCLVLADGFFEWKWLDRQGKEKQKYLITLPENEPFAFAGLWNTWINKQTGDIIETYTILTTEANEQMSIIHNSKKRMPMILTQNEEASWLENKPIAFQRNFELKAYPIS